MKERLDGRISIALPTRHTSWYHQKSDSEKQSIREKFRLFLEQLWLLEHGGDSEEQVIRRKLIDAQSREEQLMQDYSQAQSERQAYEAYLKQLSKSQEQEYDEKIKQAEKDNEFLVKGPLRYEDL